LPQFSLKNQRRANLESQLRRLGLFMDALDTPVGQELLSDLWTEFDRLFELVLNVEATDLEKLQFQFCRSQLERWTAKVREYYGNVNELKDLDKERQNND
jgi:hypothetical protein